MSDAVDVAVVGGGILGTSVAHALARDGARVALLEARSIGAGTSTHTFAWLNATSKYTDETYHRLNAAGMARHRKLARAFGEQRLGLGGCGMLCWTAMGDEAGLSKLQSQYQCLQRFDYPVRWLESHELESMEPHVAFPEDAQGLVALADGWVDGQLLTRFLAHRVRALGGDIREGCRARALLCDGRGRVQGLATDNGEVHAASVVLAAGPDTASLLGTFCPGHAGAGAFPMTRVKGLLLQTPGLDPWRWLRYVHYAACHGELHMRPAGNHALLLGAEDLDADVAEDDSAAALAACAGIMLERLHRYLPALPREVSAERCTPLLGVRPMPADGLPIVGSLPFADGLYVMITHSGMTLGPLLGDLLAGEIIDGRMSEALAPYRYERFQ